MFQCIIVHVPPRSVVGAIAGNADAEMVLLWLWLWFLLLTHQYKAELRSSGAINTRGRHTSTTLDMRDERVEAW
jgi:hypothetical protein